MVLNQSKHLQTFQVLQTYWMAQNRVLLVGRRRYLHGWRSQMFITWAVMVSEADRRTCQSIPSGAGVLHLLTLGLGRSVGVYVVLLL